MTTSSQKTPFAKMHGLGNDFIIFDARSHAGLSQLLDAKTLQYLADRRTGIGFDQAIVIESARQKDHDVVIRFFNSDGSESGACGNGTRCVADLLMHQGGQLALRMAVGPRILHAIRTEDGMISVDMGIPSFDWQAIPLSHAVDTLSVPLALGDLRAGSVVNVGNPHLVFFVDDCTAIPLETLGPLLEHDKLFPERTNVEAAHIVTRSKIRLRVWERGAGLTQACGSGACATLVAAVRRNLSDRRAEIVLDGGSLWIEWRESDQHMIMTGPSVLVYHGVIDLTRHG